MNFRETMKRAELEAVAAALGNVASEVTSFLNGVPRILRSQCVRRKTTRTVCRHLSQYLASQEFVLANS